MLVNHLHQLQTSLDKIETHHLFLLAETVNKVEVISLQRLGLELVWFINSKTANLKNEATINFYRLCADSKY